LTGIDEFGRHQTEVILPEDMAGESPQSHDDRHGIGRRANRIRIFWVADDADDTIFGQRAGRPRRRPSGTKLSAGDVMPDFNRSIKAISTLTSKRKVTPVRRGAH
jgi:hypothetical protein